MERLIWLILSLFFLVHESYAQVQVIQDLNDQKRGINPRSFTLYNGSAYFIGENTEGADVIWVTDGTEAGSMEAAFSLEQSNLTNPRHLVASRTSLYFIANHGDERQVLCQTNDALSGFNIVASAYRISFRKAYLDYLIIASQADEFKPLALEAYIPSENSTKNLQPLPFGNPRTTVIFKNQFYYLSANDLFVIDQELTHTAMGTANWLSISQDGQDSILIIDRSSSGENEVTVFIGNLVKTFPTQGAINATWYRNGDLIISHLGGIDLITDVKGEPIIYPRLYDRPIASSNLESVSGVSIFGDTELMYLNHDSVGIDVLKQLSAEVVRNPSNLTVLNEKIVFSVKGQSGSEIWISDGTAEGTEGLSAAWPGTSSSVQPIARHLGHVVFQTMDMDRGSSLWISDGTSSGTQIIPNSVYCDKAVKAPRASPLILNNELLLSNSAHSCADGIQIRKLDIPSKTLTTITHIDNGSKNVLFLDRPNHPSNLRMGRYTLQDGPMAHIIGFMGIPKQMAT